MDKDITVVKNHSKTGSGNFFRQIVNFQKLMFDNIFRSNIMLKNAECDKGKGNGRTANAVVYLMFLMLIYSLLLYGGAVGSFIYFPVFYGLTAMSVFLFTNSGMLLKTFPVKKKFVVANLMLLYPLGFMAIVVLILAVLFITTIVMAIVTKNIVASLKFLSMMIVPNIKMIIFVLMAGLCIFAVMLAINLVRTQWLKVTLAALFMTATVSVPVYSRLFLGPDYFNNITFTTFVSRLNSGQYCIIIASLCAIFLLIYALCVKLYGNRA